MKFIKRLFILLMVLAIGLVGYAFYAGIPIEELPDHLEQKITELLQSKSDNEDDDIASEPIEPDHSTNAEQKPSTGSKKDLPIFELLPLPNNPFKAVDDYARACPAANESSVQALASYLKQGTESDLEKARAIYVWLTDNVMYDDNAYNSGNYPNYTPEYVLSNKKAVCDGFGTLFKALGDEMGLEIKKVSGYSKGYGYTVGDHFVETTHAWNLIKIAGEWRVFDATWGQGNGSNVNGKLVSKKQFNEYWFNVDPYEAIFTHLPEHSSFQKVSPTIDLATYEKLPYVREQYFGLGFDGSTAFKDALANKRLQFPKCYSHDSHIEIRKAPPYSLMSFDNTHRFEVYAPRAYKMALIDSKGKWSYLEREDGVFRIDFKPENEGQLNLHVSFDKDGRSFSGLLQYEVRKRREV